MYDTEKRVRLVKKRVLEKRYWQERSLICRLSVLCMVRHRECMALFFCMRMPGAMC